MDVTPVPKSKPMQGCLGVVGMLILQIVCGALAGFCFGSSIVLLIKYLDKAGDIAKKGSDGSYIARYFKSVPWATWAMMGCILGFILILAIWVLLNRCVAERRHQTIKFYLMVALGVVFLGSFFVTAIGIFGKATFSACDPTSKRLPGLIYKRRGGRGGGGMKDLSDEGVCPLYKGHMWVSFILGLLFLAAAIPRYLERRKDAHDAKQVRYDALKAHDPDFDPHASFSIPQQTQEQQQQQQQLGGGPYQYSQTVWQNTAYQGPYGQQIGPSTAYTPPQKGGYYSPHEPQGSPYNPTPPPQQQDTAGGWQNYGRQY